MGSTQVMPGRHFQDVASAMQRQAAIKLQGLQLASFPAHFLDLISTDKQL
jgi:hypothetical protein